MTKQTHHIDFDKLKDFAHVGVRRAVIFMGLGAPANGAFPSNSSRKRFPPSA